MKIILTLLIGAMSSLFLSGCGRIPAKVDMVQYVNYSRIVEQQIDSECNLIGMYRLNSSKDAIINHPSEATPMLGDFMFAAIRRGAEIQFVSLSGYSDFGSISDQGPGFSINFQGSVFWSFKNAECTAQATKYIGKYTGIVENKEGLATLEIMDGWVRIQVVFENFLKPSDASNGNATKLKNSTYFLTRIQ